MQKHRVVGAAGERLSRVTTAADHRVSQGLMQGNSFGVVGEHLGREDGQQKGQGLPPLTAV